VTDYLLSDGDRATVERIAADARRAGSDAVASTVAIHAKSLERTRADLRYGLVRVEHLRRSIAMHELAMRLLEPES
jgi:hypothetical protein